MDNQHLRQIQSNPNYYIDIAGNVYTSKFKIRKHSYHPAGYPVVVLKRSFGQLGSKYRTKSIHRLVLEYFLRMPNENEECNHIDGNKLNYSIFNLEWVTHLENVKHSIEMGLATDRGETHHNARLTEKDVLNIRDKISKGVLQKDIMKEYDLSQQHVSAIHTKKKWANL